MKTKYLLLIALVFASFVMPAYAQEIVEQGAPEWLYGALSTLLATLGAIPKVGPILVVLFKTISIVSMILTLIVPPMMLILKVPEVALLLAKKNIQAEKVAKISDKVLYWLKYLSQFNAQKKQIEEKK